MRWLLIGVIFFTSLGFNTYRTLVFYHLPNPVPFLFGDVAVSLFQAWVISRLAKEPS